MKEECVFVCELGMRFACLICNGNERACKHKVCNNMCNARESENQAWQHNLRIKIYNKIEKKRKVKQN